MPDGGDPRLRQLAADTGDHATGRSAARFAPPWKIPRGGSNRRSVDRFIPRLWGNIGPAWSPSMSIPAHPHARGEHLLEDGRSRAAFGSSPLPWGTPRPVLAWLPQLRFIPTPVGNTRPARAEGTSSAVHPHTRGEHSTSSMICATVTGSSPHPWGTPCPGGPLHHQGRFIPTPVGNTPSAPGPAGGPAVHPHTRGEHELCPCCGSCTLGSSPHPWGTRLLATSRRGERAVHPHTRGEHSLLDVDPADPDGSSPHPWGTQLGDVRAFVIHRFIPTPVGNTTACSSPVLYRSVHPHTRGEHYDLAVAALLFRGSSPHPWGTPARSSEQEQGSRFIPTPVGNTRSEVFMPQSSAVHPHTRGEHISAWSWFICCTGSSPHPWGTLLRDFGGGAMQRFIPTPVGNTWLTTERQSFLPVHPHTRGEHFSGALFKGFRSGSSPHPWGTRAVNGADGALVRFIPTPVGNTLTVSHCFKKKKNNSKIPPGQAALAPLPEMRVVLIPQPNPAAPSGPVETYPHRNPAVPQAD
ncbi:Domain of uncharacterised function (DUF2825) [Pseudomonas aeruginosa]|nr:Domain of uncharacterised function (DUF2825) [Pseudomonas aeruginosa]